MTASYSHIRTFSAGADLTVVKGLSPEGVRDWRCAATRWHGCYAARPSRCWARRWAVGGGLEMTLHCDLRFAAIRRTITLGGGMTFEDAPRWHRD